MRLRRSQTRRSCLSRYVVRIVALFFESQRFGGCSPRRASCCARASREDCCVCVGMAERRVLETPTSVNAAATEHDNSDWRVLPQQARSCSPIRPSSFPPSSSSSMRTMASLLSGIVKPLAYASIPVFVLHTLAQSSPIARYYVRLAVYISTLGVCSAWGMICAVGMSLIGRKLDVFFVVGRSFYALASRTIGIKLIVEGEEHLQTRPAVFVGNHQSMLDILYLGRCVRRALHPPSRS